MFLKTVVLSGLAATAFAQSDRCIETYNNAVLTVSGDKALCEVVNEFVVCVADQRVPSDAAVAALQRATNGPVANIDCAAEGVDMFTGSNAADDALLAEDARASASITSGDGTLNVRVAQDAPITFKRATLDTVTMNQIETDAASLRGHVDGVQINSEKRNEVIVDMRKKVVEVTEEMNGASANIGRLQTQIQGVSDLVVTTQQQTAERLAEQASDMQVKLDDATGLVQDLLNTRLAEIRNTVNAQYKKLTDKQNELVDKVVKPLDDVDAAGGEAVSKLTTTHFNDKQAIVYRWNEWHTYNNCCVGWFDGNNPRGFGGRHPSQWGDGNALAHDMHPSMRYMKRLFSKRGYGDAFGATVCALTWEMPHSTDDRRCGAFFRIKNTETSGKTWNVQWHWTGWHGWGNYASLAVNKGNHWHGECYSMCYRNENINIPANGAGDRISSVAFVTGGSAPYGHYNHHRMVYLSFQKLDLPDGLEFVDDMETVGGEWR
jgi:hypothetical protein